MTKKCATCKHLTETLTFCLGCIKGNVDKYNKIDEPEHCKTCCGKNYCDNKVEECLSGPKLQESDPYWKPVKSLPKPVADNPDPEVVKNLKVIDDYARKVISDNPDKVGYECCKDCEAKKDTVYTFCENCKEPDKERKYLEGIVEGKRIERELWQSCMQDYSNALRMVRQVLELEVPMKAEENIEPPIQNAADEIVRAIEKIRAEGRKQALKEVDKVIDFFIETVDTSNRGIVNQTISPKYSKETISALTELKQAIDQLRKGDK